MILPGGKTPVALHNGSLDLAFRRALDQPSDHWLIEVSTTCCCLATLHRKNSAFAYKREVCQKKRLISSLFFLLGTAGACRDGLNTGGLSLLDTEEEDGGADGDVDGDTDADTDGDTDTDTDTDIEGVCGDLLLSPGEACDDGNTVSNDGCSGDCREVESHKENRAPSFRNPWFTQSEWVSSSLSPAKTTLSDRIPESYEAIKGTNWVISGLRGMSLRLCRRWR